MEKENNKFTCGICGNTYERGWSEEQANKEANELWGVKDASTNPDMIEICDDCFNNRTPKERQAMGEEFKSMPKITSANQAPEWEGQIRILANYAFDREGELQEPQFQNLITFISNLLSQSQEEARKEVLQEVQNYLGLKCDGNHSKYGCELEKFQAHFNFYSTSLEEKS